MKKIMLTLVAVLTISIASVYAQDTLSTAKETGKSIQQVPKGYTQMKISDAPSSLRTTLGGQEYIGWESGWIYQNSTNNQYLVRIGTGDNTRSYYFDNSGKRVKDPEEN
jgi:hypothetical protein